MRQKHFNPFGQQALKLMRYFIFLVLFIEFPFALNAHKINGYNYIYIEETGNIYGVEDQLKKYFSNLGFKTVASYEYEDMNNESKSQLLIATYQWNIVNGGHSTLILTLSDITGSVIYRASGQGISWSAKGDMKNALKKIFKQIDALHYKFNPDQIKAKGSINHSFSSWTEDSIKNYLRTTNPREHRDGYLFHPEIFHKDKPLP